VRRSFGGPPKSARPVKLSFSNHTVGRRADSPRYEKRAEKRANGTRAEEPPYGPEWEAIRQIVIRRDNYTCTNPSCRKVFRPPKHGKLDVHHIKRRERGGPDTPDNLRTLCKPCHALEHPHLLKIGYGQAKKKRRK
jgi:5-methylcytosine-specific restriction endonuclease McrA